MSDLGGYPDVEGDDVGKKISQHDIEAVLSGGVPTDPSLDALAALIRSSDFAETVPEHVASRHVAAAASMAAGAHHGVGATAPGGRRRRLLFRGALSGLTAKILFGTAVALAATGGAAVTGILPDPIQSVLADGASHLGIELRNPQRSTTTTTTSTTTAVTTTTATVITVTTTTIDPGEGGLGVLAGSYTWESTACVGDPISVVYTVAENGTLALDEITGDLEAVAEDTDRIEVRFADGVRIRIEISGSGEDARIDEDERRDCSDDPSDDGDGTDDGQTDDPSEDGDDGDESEESGEPSGDDDPTDGEQEDPAPDGDETEDEEIAD